MADDDELLVTIADDTSAGVDAGKDVADPVEELKAQYNEVVRRDEARQREVDAANRRAADATQREEAARKDAQSARGEVADSQADSIASGIAAASAEAEAAEREYKEAFEAGDAGKMATAQRKIARAEARSVRLDEAKADLEARKAEPITERGQRAAPGPTDPVETYITGRTEPTANWLRAHKDWITDSNKNARLTSAHWDAVANNLTPDTPEYFSHVETVIGLKQADTVVRTNGAATNGAAKPQIQRRPAVTVAPVQASGGGTSGGDTVVLTKGEAAAATDGSLIWNYDDTSPQKRFKKGDPIGVQEFARRKREMKKQGLYDKQYTEA